MAETKSDSASTASPSTSNKVEHTTDISNHDLYLDPSPDTGLKLTQELLIGDNYQTWRQLIITALIAKNKLEFIDKSISPPQKSSNFKQWSQCDNVIKSWLYNSISNDIRTSIISCKYASEIWSNLEDQFSQVKGPRLFQLEQDISTLIQGTMPIATYFTKLKGLWDELSALQPNSSCKCGALQDDPREQQCRLMKFLMGLNESYAPVRKKILSSKHLPSVNDAYDLVLQEECQRNITLAPTIEGIALAAKSHHAIICKDTNKLEDKEDEERRSTLRKPPPIPNVYLVVAAIIATVTFAACITMPGGFEGKDGSHPGSALLSKSVAFNAFVVIDTISMGLSSSALFIYLWVSFPFPSKKNSNKEDNNLLSLASWFILGAMVTMGLAFLTGIYAVLMPSSGLANSTCIIGLIFIAILFYVLQKCNNCEERVVLK